MPRDFRGALAVARAVPTKSSGDAGDTGDTRNSPEEKAGNLPVTSPETALVTLVTAPVDGTRVTSGPGVGAIASGDAKCSHKQLVRIPVTTVTGVTSQIEEVEERAAIMEADAHMPRAWADAFAAIVHGPVRFPEHPARWQSVVDGALAFADQWAGQSYRLGWTVDELLGLDPIAPAARLDRRGLAFLLGNGPRVLAINASGADIMNAQGSRQRFYRQHRSAA